MKKKITKKELLERGMEIKALKYIIERFYAKNNVVWPIEWDTKT